MIRKALLISSTIILSWVGLSGCQSTNGCSDNDTKCFAPSQSFLKKAPQQPSLHPDYNYIRLKMNGHIAWLAQGSVDSWPANNTKVFYSADRSVFKWANGRLVSVTMPSLNWRERITSNFIWSMVSPYQFNREVDTIDGAIAVKEQRLLKRANQPKHHDYIGDSTILVWVHESTVAKTPPLLDQNSYDSWYAFKSDSLDQPVYGQQCLDKHYCMTWQIWEKL